MDFSFVLTVVSIIFVDLLLSGDNAILIALASRNLPKQQQKISIFWGTAGAIVLRIIFAFIAAELVQIPLLKAVGGVALLWIAVKLLAGNEQDPSEHKAAASLRAAIRTIIIADGIMSLDNVLAVVALANGHLGLVIFGIAISIPFVMLSSQWLLKMMERFPAIIYVGTAVLGYAATGMITSDKWLSGYLHSYAMLINITLTIIVVVVGHILKQRQLNKVNN